MREENVARRSRAARRVQPRKNPAHRLGEELCLAPQVSRTPYRASVARIAPGLLEIQLGLSVGGGKGHFARLARRNFEDSRTQEGQGPDQGALPSPLDEDGLDAERGIGPYMQARLAHDLRAEGEPRGRVVIPRYGHDDQPRIGPDGTAQEGIEESDGLRRGDASIVKVPGEEEGGRPTFRKQGKEALEHGRLIGRDVALVQGLAEVEIGRVEE